MGLKQKLKKKITKIQVQQQNISICEGKYLVNKVALIIGGSGGIGEGIARKYIDNGCSVIISGTNENKLKEICCKLGSNCKYIVMDVRNVNEIHNGIERAIKIFDRIDILVNSAGVHGSQKFGQVKEDTYDSVLDVNLKAMFFTCQEISNYMIENGIKGHILNVSSASCAKPAWTPYEISKWGVRGFTLGLADLLIANGIIVNAIAPGPVSTKMINKENTNDLSMPINPSGRVVTVEEVANLALFMVSSAGDMIVGDTFFISGGSGTIKMHNS